MKRFRSILFLLAMALLFGAASAHAYLVAVEVLWTDTNLSTLAGDPYYLQPGSIIQLVAYNSTAMGVNPPPTPAENPVDEANFQHYGSSLIPDTTPAGHQIVGTGTLQDLSAEYGDGVYGMTAIVNLPDEYNYDSLYVRVFSATGFEQGVVSSNVHWGISAVNPVSEHWGTGLTWFDEVEAPNVANFELIPEPSSLAFLLSGGCGMGVCSLFRRRRKLRPPEE